MSIGKFGPAAATPTVISALNSVLVEGKNQVCPSRDRILAETVESISQLGPAAATHAIIDALVDLLMYYATYSSYEENAGRSREVATCLGQIGLAAATTEVRERLKSLIFRCDDLLVNENELDVFLALGFQVVSWDRLASLMERNERRGKSFKIALIHFIGHYGSTAAVPEILPYLVKWLNNWDRDVREWTAVALEQLGSVAATPAVIEALTKQLRRGRNRRYSIHMLTFASALVRFGAEGATPVVVATLLKRLNRREWHVGEDEIAKLVTQWMQTGLRFFSVRRFVFWKRWQARSVSSLAQDG